MTITNFSTNRAVFGDLGRRLSRSRLDHDLTQAQLAEEAGISKATLERLERGDDVRMDSFIRVLRALGQLDQLDRLVPEPLPSPIERVELRGRQRKRASGRGKSRQEVEGPAWRWGDEEPEQ